MLCLCNVLFGIRLQSFSRILSTSTYNNVHSVTSNAVAEWVNPSQRIGSYNTQVFKLNAIYNGSYWSIFVTGYIGNIGAVQGYIKYEGGVSELLKFDGSDYGTYKPTVSFNPSTRELKITSTGSGIDLLIFGAKPLRWE